MKKMPTRFDADDLRPEYDFDYSKARPNPYAARLKGHSVAVLLAPDVAPSFPTADSVNEILRAVINAVPRTLRAARGGRDNNELQQTSRASKRQRPARN